MTADWTTCRVVRDRLRGLMGRRGDTWRGLDRLGLHDFTRAEMDDYAREFGPLVPVLDADGHPVVTTVGDLGARHIGKRVRLRGEYGYVVAVSYVHHSGRGTRLTGHVVGGLGGTYANTSPSTTPCEVLDA